MSKTSKIIVYILIVALLAGAIFTLVYFTDIFSKNTKSFYLECEGQTISTSASGFEMTKDNPLKVNVNYMDDETTGYSIKVVPNIIADKDFNFKLDEDVYSYQAERDLTEGFDIDQQEKSFTIKPKGGITEILQAIYPNNVVEDCRVFAYENMYTLVVVSYDEESSVLLHFTIPETLAGVYLDQGEIVF